MCLHYGHTNPRRQTFRKALETNLKQINREYGLRFKYVINCIEPLERRDIGNSIGATYRRNHRLGCMSLFPLHFPEFKKRSLWFESLLVVTGLLCLICDIILLFCLLIVLKVYTLDV